MSDNIQIKIPKFHYLGMNSQGGGQVPLGFITPYEYKKDGKTPDAATLKRCSTVDNWASSCGRNQKELKTHIIKNEAVSGFKISHSFKRGNNWGRGNIIWRIEDPRGFELEISNSNMLEVMLCTTIVEGEIYSPCIWGRDGADNILIPTDSDLYKDAIANTKRLEKTVSFREVKPGNTITLQNGIKGKFLGKYYLITFGKNYQSTEQPLPYEFDISQNKRFAILDTSTNEKPILYFLGSTPKVSTIDDSSIGEVIDLEKEINDIISSKEVDIQSSRGDSIWSLHAAVSENMPLSDIKFSIESITQENIEKLPSEYFDAVYLICNATDHVGITTTTSYKINPNRRSRINSAPSNKTNIDIIDREKLFTERKFCFVGELRRGSSAYYGSSATGEYDIKQHEVDKTDQSNNWYVIYGKLQVPKTDNEFTFMMKHR